VSGLQANAQLCFSLQPGNYSSLTAPNLQHTANQERNEECGNQQTQSRAPNDGHSNARNILSLQEIHKIIRGI